MSVRYKFKNDLEFNAVPCDGFHISVIDLKRTIIRAKRLGRVTDFDLQITNQQTGEVYSTEDGLIPKNSTLIIVRVPLSAGQKKIWEAEKLPQSNPSSHITSSSDKSFTSSTDGASEEDKISTMMSNSAEMYDRKNWVVYRGKAAFPGKPPPITYRCNRCHQTGHWVQDCALIKAGMGGQELKKTTGIPRSFLKPANIDTPGAKINPQGMYMVNELETQAYRDKKVDKPMWDNDNNVSSASVNMEIPSDLKCPVCHDLLKDAIMLPTCACATCDECARNALIESENNTCPVCNEADNCPDDLIPCRKLRDKVNKFKNTSGYAAKTQTSIPAVTKIMSPKSATPTLPDIVLPNQFDILSKENNSNSIAKVSPSLVTTIKQQQKENTPPVDMGLAAVTTAEKVASYNNSPYGNTSEDAATPLTSEPPIPGVVDNDDEHDVFKSKVILRSPDSIVKPSPQSPTRSPSPLQKIVKSPQSPIVQNRSHASPRSPRGHPPTYSNGLSIPVSLPDTSLPPPGFMGSLPTYLPPPLSRYGVPPHNPTFRGHPHLPHMPMPNRFPGRRDPPPIPGQQNYIEDPLETFNRLMAQKDQKKKYRSRSRSPHYRHSPSRRVSPRGGPPGRYRHPSSPHPPPRGPRTPPLSPRQSSTPPPGDSPHHPAPVGGESPRSSSPRGRHISPRRRTPSPVSPRRRSHSPRRYSRSRSRSRQRSRTPDYQRRYYDEDRYQNSRRSYHSSDPRYRENYPYRDEYSRSRGTRGSRGRIRGRSRGGYYDRRSPPPPPSHHSIERSRRDQRSYSNERTPSLSPEPENHQRYTYNRYPQNAPDNSSRDYGQYQRQPGGYNEEESHRTVSINHHKDDGDYHHRSKSDKYTEPPEMVEEQTVAAPVMVKKKKEKKKKRKKEESVENQNEVHADESKKKKKKAKKVKTKKTADDETERSKKKSKEADMKEKKPLPPPQPQTSSEVPIVKGRYVEDVSEETKPPPRNDDDVGLRVKEYNNGVIDKELKAPSSILNHEEESQNNFKKECPQMRIELVPELSKWEREDLLVADSSTSPQKEERNNDYDKSLSSEKEEYERCNSQDSEDLRDMLKSKKSSTTNNEENDKVKKKKKSKELQQQPQNIEGSESEGVLEKRHHETKVFDKEEESEEIKKKKKKKKKQKEMEKKIEKKLRKEMKKKLKEKLKKKTKNRESTVSPIPSPSPPPPPSKDYNQQVSSRRRDVKSERGDNLKITFDRNNHSESRSPSGERKRRSTSEEEFNRNRVSLMKLSGTDVRDSKSNNNSSRMELQQPSRKLSIKDRLGPIKRSRSPEVRRNHRDGRRKEDSSKERRRFEVEEDRNVRDQKPDSRNSRIHSAASDSRKRSEPRRSREREVSDKKRRRSPSLSKESKRNKDNWSGGGGGNGDYSSSKRSKKKESSSRKDDLEKSRKNRKNSSKLKSRYENECRNSRGYNSDSN
ncbi:LOW QUALITY PROTEIN: uncharacterized protein [Lepeophtheirus salmonis]|uniref:LOW QUALITY PROTEIN: uncharacterized protein n=1 Tax=Lepeophtheirus salmonis TaxID=72036 RepID=UPI003AF350DC